MQPNPYQSLSDTRFWSTGVKLPVSEQSRLSIDPLLNSLSSDDPVVSAGSCFASYVGKELTSRNFNYLRSRFSGDRVESFGLGNIYTIAQLKQWLEFTLNIWTWADECVYEDDKSWLDYLLPHRVAVSSQQELLEYRHNIKDEILDYLSKAKVFIFTIGLTETWLNSSGDVYPACPGTLIGAFEESEHSFHNCTFEEIYSDLQLVEKLLLQINPEIKLVYTVSPVPLTATATEQHVLLATTYSKSVIRAALGQYCQNSECGSYFPSYELINHHTQSDWRFDKNLRSISSLGVRYVMGHAFSDEDVFAELPVENERASTETQDQEAVCEEEMLEAYSKSADIASRVSDIVMIGDSHMERLSRGFNSRGVVTIGGQVMNGSGFSDGKFELSDDKVFLPMENEKSKTVWSRIFSKLDTLNGSCHIITNIGFQTHRTINHISNKLNCPVLSEVDIATYFEQNYAGQMQILKGLKKYGKVWMVEDPNFYAFIAGKDTSMTIRDKNFHQYCSYLRKVAHSLEIEYLNPCDLVLQRRFKEINNFADLVDSDGFHGLQIYYDYSAEIIDTIIKQS